MIFYIIYTIFYIIYNQFYYKKMNNKYTIMYFLDWKERQVSDNMEKENVPPILYPEHISYIRENYPSLSVLEGNLSFYYTEQKGFSLEEWKKQMKEAIEYVFYLL